MGGLGKAYNLLRQICIVSSSGTLVNNELTSKEHTDSISTYLNRPTEHFKALTKSSHLSAIADHIISTGHNIKWDHFQILATGRSDVHCKIKETLLIKDLKPKMWARDFFTISLLYISSRL